MMNFCRMFFVVVPAASALRFANLLFGDQDETKIEKHVIEGQYPLKEGTYVDVHFPEQYLKDHMLEDGIDSLPGQLGEVHHTAQGDMAEVYPLRSDGKADDDYIFVRQADDDISNDENDDENLPTVDELFPVNGASVDGYYLTPRAEDQPLSEAEIRGVDHVFGPLWEEHGYEAMLRHGSKD